MDRTVLFSEIAYHLKQEVEEEMNEFRHWQHIIKSPMQKVIFIFPFYHFNYILARKFKVFSLTMYCTSILYNSGLHISKFKI